MTSEPNSSNNLVNLEMMPDVEDPSHQPLPAFVDTTDLEVGHNDVPLDSHNGSTTEDDSLISPLGGASVSDIGTPQFAKRDIFDDSSNSGCDYQGTESSSRSLSTSVEDLTQGSEIPRRSNSLGVLHELTQEAAEKLLNEPPTSKSVGDLALESLSTDVTDAKDLSVTASPSLAQRFSRKRTESGSSDISLSASQQEQDLMSALRKMGLSLKRDENMEQVEELMQNLLIITFTILWKGVEGSDIAAWKVLLHCRLFCGFVLDMIELARAPTKINPQLSALDCIV